MGLVTAVEYGDALYCFNFSVVPSLRGRGLGRRLQHECQHVALTCGFNKVSGTVDTSSPRLVNYYLALGGRLVPTGACRWLLRTAKQQDNVLSHHLRRREWRCDHGAAEHACGEVV